MPSQWAVEMIQKIQLNCGEGAAGCHKKCLKELEKIVLEIDKKMDVEGRIGHSGPISSD